MVDLSDITIKKHPRARHVKLKASVRHGIELIVPLRFNQKLLPDILERNKIWIDKRLKEIQAALKDTASDQSPEVLPLLALGTSWKIIYIKTNSNKIKLLTRANLQEIVLMGKSDDKTLCKQYLIRWLKSQAKKHIIPALTQLSVEIDLPFSTVAIRGQQTRWGSCSADKSISLNYKLLFLPPELMRHILIHELAHTVQLNHSVKFWRLVAQFDPDWKKHHVAIRKINKSIHAWFN